MRPSGETRNKTKKKKQKKKRNKKMTQSQLGIHRIKGEIGRGMR